MFKDIKQGETQYCSMCEEWAEKYERLQTENELLKFRLMGKTIDEWKQLQAENKELKHKNEILLGQLVINDGEDVTVQISQSQFEEYNELKAENERLKEENSKIVWDEVCTTNCSKYKAYNKYRKALEEIREIAGDAIDMIIENDKLLSYVGSIYNKINEVLDERN